MSYPYPYPYFPLPYAAYPPHPYPDPESFETRIQLPPIYKRSNNYLPYTAMSYEYIPAHWEVYKFEEDPNPPNPDDEKEQKKTQNINPSVTIAGQTNATKDPKTQGVFRPNKQYEIKGNVNADSVPQPQFYEHQEPDTVTRIYHNPTKRV